MSVLPPALFESLASDASLWPGELSETERADLEARIVALPEDARSAVLSALVDPDRNPWARAVLLAARTLGEAGGSVVGMLTDDVVEAVDARGDRFGVQPLGFRLQSHPSGDPEDVARLMRALDAAFGTRRYILWVRRPVPPGLDVEPIRRAVQLWLSGLDRGDRVESHAVYEDDDVAIDLTVLDGAGSGRLLTVPPLGALERLARVDASIVEAATRSEEIVGDCPLVVVLSADARWLVSRGYVQQLLYGTPDVVLTERTLGEGGSVAYEAAFTANGRSLFSDPACRRVGAVWWIEPDAAATPMGHQLRVLENPWADQLPALTPPCPRFVPTQTGHKARMKWEGR
ncbi:MAG: hypothetical protein H6738_14160 [Alphaproteobacteria bacterium]|nr:hypothetical protein [Alphaproteobacteria bacterium]MCB9697919.1 hypothetical protein [Alphaproteobacteria bacterium]